MNRIHNKLIGRCLLFLFSLLILTSCSDNSSEGLLIITLVPEINDNPNYTSGDNWRYLAESRIVSVDPNNPDAEAEPLTEGFYSACHPEISYDGKRMLFAAQIEKFDVWQIWEMELKDKIIRQVTSFNENCTDPAYLPENRFIFSKTIPLEKVGDAHALFSGNVDGTGFKQITFQPGAEFATTILKDGRALTLSKQFYPHKNASRLMIMRPDGTKADLFYFPAENHKLLGKAWETSSGNVYFIEQDSIGGSDIIQIHQDRPLNTRQNLTEALQGEFQSLALRIDGNLLVTYKDTKSDKFSLFGYLPKEKELMEELFSSKEFHVVEAVEVFSKERPRKLPSAVNERMETGLIMCQNINKLGSEAADSGEEANKVVINGIHKTLGTIDVEDDGSFYLKVEANLPIQFQAINEKGEALGDPSAWLWLRPNERRACVGCHADRELAPENKVVMAVRKPPITINAEGIVEGDID